MSASLLNELLAIELPSEAETPSPEVAPTLETAAVEQSTKSGAENTEAISADSAVDGTTSEATEPVDEVDALFDSAEKPPTGIPELDSLEPDPGWKESSQERFRGLANRAREAEQRAAQAQAQFEQTQAQLAQVQAVARKLAAARRTPQPGQTQAQANAQAAADPQVQQLMQTVQGLQHQLQQQGQFIQQTQQAQRQAEMLAAQEAEDSAILEKTATLRKYVAPGVPDEYMNNPDFVSVLDSMVINTAFAQQIPLEQALPEVQKNVRLLVKGFNAALRAKGRQLAEPAAPAVGSSGVPGGTVSGTDDGMRAQLPNYSKSQWSAKYPSYAKALGDGFRQLQGIEPEGGFL